MTERKKRKREREREPPPLPLKNYIFVLNAHAPTTLETSCCCCWDERVCESKAFLMSAIVSSVLKGNYLATLASRAFHFALASRRTAWQEIVWSHDLAGSRPFRLWLMLELEFKGGFQVWIGAKPGQNWVWWERFRGVVAGGLGWMAQ